MKRMLLVLMCVCLVSMAQAAIVSYQSSAPTVGAEDVAFLVESTTDEGNVAGGDDAASYFAHDRPGMGQTFTTGSDPAGYMMGGFWLKNVDYDTPSGNGTWWYLDNEAGQEGGSQMELRVVDPSQAGTADFVMNSEVYTVTGTESGNELMPVNWNENKTGTGTWVHFDLDTSVALAPDTTYGFDLTVILGDWGYFFETAGVNGADAYTGGSAYQTTDGANGTNSLNMDTLWDGDHTFIVDMVPEIPEPATLALLGLGALVLRRRR